jgi:hypothetical protein
MKYLIISSLVLFLCSGCNSELDTEVEAVKTVIVKSYVEAIHNDGSIEDIKAGFHSDFEMLSIKGEELSRFSISEWIERIERSRSENPNQKRGRTDVKFIDIDVTGDAASAKFELLRDGKAIFTDYMFLYKYSDGWRIVCKVYHRH